MELLMKIKKRMKMRVKRIYNLAVRLFLIVLLQTFE